MLEPTLCGACGTELTEEVERTTTRLLAGLDDARRARLDTYYGDLATAPERLCAGCFNVTASVLNQGVTSGN